MFYGNYENGKRVSSCSVHDLASTHSHNDEVIEPMTSSLRQGLDFKLCYGVFFGSSSRCPLLCILQVERNAKCANSDPFQEGTSSKWYLLVFAACFSQDFVTFLMVYRFLPLRTDSEITYRVWFCDIDNYGHMNNSCYNLYCDYGRYNCAIRLFGIKALRSAYCVVGTADIQYIRSMKLFQKFVLRTSVVAVSGKNVMFRQVYRMGVRSER